MVHNVHIESPCVSVIVAYDEDEHTSLKEQIEVYSMLETAWHLCEILFIETLPLGCLIQQLLEWVGCRYISEDCGIHNSQVTCTIHAKALCVINYLDLWNHLTSFIIMLVLFPHYFAGSLAQ